MASGFPSLELLYIIIISSTQTGERTTFISVTCSERNTSYKQVSQRRDLVCRRQTLKKQRRTLWPKPWSQNYTLFQPTTKTALKTWSFQGAANVLFLQLGGSCVTACVQFGKIHCTFRTGILFSMCATFSFSKKILTEVNNGNIVISGCGILAVYGLFYYC